MLGTGKEKLSFPFAFAVSCNSEKKKNKQITNPGFGCGQSVILFCCIENLNADGFLLKYLKYLPKVVWAML